MRRFRLRTLMLLVAFAALPMSALAFVERRVRHFSDLADAHHRASATFGLSDLEWFLLVSPAQLDPDMPQQERKRYFDQCEVIESVFRYVQYHWSMAYKYRAAAKRPWVYPTADPPAPPPPSESDKAVVIGVLKRLEDAVGPLGLPPFPEPKLTR